jgi:hypothetical protein
MSFRNVPLLIPLDSFSHKASIGRNPYPQVIERGLVKRAALITLRSGPDPLPLQEKCLARFASLVTH